MDNLWSKCGVGVAKPVDVVGFEGVFCILSRFVSHTLNIFSTIKKAVSLSVVLVVMRTFHKPNNNYVFNNLIYCNWECV